MIRNVNREKHSKSYQQLSEKNVSFPYGCDEKVEIFPVL